MMPLSVASDEQAMKTVTRMRSTEILARRAASALPPTAWVIGAAELAFGPVLADPGRF